MKKIPLSKVTCRWCGEIMDGVKQVDDVRGADGMHSGIQCNHCGVKMASDVFDLNDMTIICAEDNPIQLANKTSIASGGTDEGLIELTLLQSEVLLSK